MRGSQIFDPVCVSRGDKRTSTLTMQVNTSPTRCGAKLIWAGVSPWDLSLSFSRMDVFCFTVNGTCRTIERLDRKVGQRRDATREPIQVRNGWGPHGRRLGQQPAARSKDCRFFV